MMGSINKTDRLDARGLNRLQRNGTLPTVWIPPAEQIDLKITPFFPEQELDTRKSTRVTYWEGAVKVSGTYRKKPIQDLGYVEMTGYAGRLKI